MEKKVIRVYWTRKSEAQSTPTLSAHKKEGEVKTYIGTPLKGGNLKFIIPDIEDNEELIETMGGCWSTKNPNELKAETAQAGRQAPKQVSKSK
jgi:hypothetical protein